MYWLAKTLEEELMAQTSLEQLHHYPQEEPVEEEEEPAWIYPQPHPPSLVDRSDT
jgi:hypothetical protein